MARVAYIELAVTETGPAKAFYEAAFGWSMIDFGPTYSATTTGEVDVGLQADPGEAPPTPLPLVRVESLEAALDAVTAAGGRISKPVFDYPDGRRFHLLDPAGNEWGVFVEES